MLLTEFPELFQASCHPAFGCIEDLFYAVEPELVCFEGRVGTNCRGGREVILRERDRKRRVGGQDESQRCALAPVLDAALLQREIFRNYVFGCVHCDIDLFKYCSESRETINCSILR